MSGLTMGSLFDGIGGFPLAAIRSGITPVWASEIEAFPIEVTKQRFPSMIHVGDITKLNGAELPPVDIICGGSPCQDLSVAGARAGLSGARSGLFMEQVRLVKEMRNADEQRGRAGHAVRPRYMLWENVPGAFSSGTPKGEDFRIVLEEIVRVKCGSVYVPGPYPWPWQSAGRILLGTDFSLAWRCLDLIKHRGIARDVVAHFAKAGLLYEDAEYHNAVFVGTDVEGVPRHAHKRSANSYGKAFRLNVEGSDPRYSFHYVGTDRSLYVFEAPIDMLSFITLYPENWPRHSYVACCGTSIQPVLQMLEQVPQLDTVLLCLDNDEAGHQASRRMQNQLEVRYSVERLIPENKDWNDDLTLNSENAQGLAMNEMR